jgi:hypothetical protein
LVNKDAGQVRGSAPDYFPMLTIRGYKDSFQCQCTLPTWPTALLGSVWGQNTGQPHTHHRCVHVIADGVWSAPACRAAPNACAVHHPKGPSTQPGRPWGVQRGLQVVCRHLPAEGPSSSTHYQRAGPTPLHSRQVLAEKGGGSRFGGDVGGESVRICVLRGGPFCMLGVLYVQAPQ